MKKHLRVIVLCLLLVGSSLLPAFADAIDSAIISVGCEDRNIPCSGGGTNENLDATVKPEGFFDDKRHRLSESGELWLGTGNAVITPDGLCGVPVNRNRNSNRIIDDYAQIEDLKASVTASCYMSVDVHIPVDEEYRALAGTNWSNRVVSTIENADDYFFDNFQINWNVKKTTVWNSSNSASDTELLSDVKQKHGLSGCQMMIAFSAQSGNTSAGWGDVGSPYSLVIHSGSHSNDQIVARHEVGHNYGMSHCSSSCFMNGASEMYNNYSNMCPFHTDYMNNNRTKYGLQ